MKDFVITIGVRAEDSISVEKWLNTLEDIEIIYWTAEEF